MKAILHNVVKMFTEVIYRDWEKDYQWDLLFPDVGNTNRDSMKIFFVRF